MSEASEQKKYDNKMAKLDAKMELLDGKIKEANQIILAWDGKEGEDKQIIKKGLKHKIEEEKNKLLHGIKVEWGGLVNEYGEEEAGGGLKRQIFTEASELTSSIKSEWHGPVNEYGEVDAGSGLKGQIFTEASELTSSIKSEWHGPVNEAGELDAGRGLKGEIVTEVANLKTSMKDDALELKSRIDEALSKFTSEWHGDNSSENNTGFRDEVISRITEISEYWHGKNIGKDNEDIGMYKKIEENFNKLKQTEKTANSILRQSGTAALSTGYISASEVHEKNAKEYEEKFSELSDDAIKNVYNIGVKILLPTILVVGVIGAFGKELGLQVFLLIGSLVFAYVGFIRWRINFFNNRVRDEQILHAEYAHKNSLTIVFDAYRQQIDDLYPEGSEDYAKNKESLNSLYKSMIESASYNPSNRLKQKGDDGFFGSLISKWLGSDK